MATCLIGIVNVRLVHFICVQQTTIYQISILILLYYPWHFNFNTGPRGLMDKASDFGSEDCEFESRRGRYFLATGFDFCIQNSHEEQLNK